MRLLAIPVLLSVLVACVADVGKDRVKAEVADAPAGQAAAPTVPAGAHGYAVDPAQSSVHALGAKITAEHPIDFKTFRGMVHVADNAVVGVVFEVEMASLEADVPKLTSHLKNEDFFDVATFPTATFTSTSITPGAEAAGATHTVTGTFTIHGVTKQLTFPATIQVAADKVTASTEFVINRQDFAITYPGKPDDLVQDNVRMNIAFVAPTA